MRFRRAVIACFQDYWTFSGRASRSEYWWFFLFVIAGSLVLSILDRVLFGPRMLLGLNGLFAMLTFLPQMAVAWRRMHDVGRPGWCNLLPAIPLVPIFSSVAKPGASLEGPGAILLATAFLGLTIMVLIWLVTPGQPKPNRYGRAAKP